jgi:hypothetical protein
VAGCCECSDEPSGSCATELVGISTVRKNTQVLLDINKKVGLEINAEKTNYMFIARKHMKM